MARVFFVTGSAGGVGVGNLQHRRALRKSTGGSRCADLVADEVCNDEPAK